MEVRELAFQHPDSLKRLKPLTLRRFLCQFKKPVTRIELVTSPLPRVCSTTEPHGQNMISIFQLKVKMLGVLMLTQSL
jgi:hypothetical protein